MTRYKVTLCGSTVCQSASLEWTPAFHHPVVPTPFLAETVLVHLVWLRTQPQPQPVPGDSTSSLQPQFVQEPTIQLATSSTDPNTTFYRHKTLLSPSPCQRKAWQRTTTALQLSADTFLLLHQTLNVNVPHPSRSVSSTADCRYQKDRVWQQPKAGHGLHLPTASETPMCVWWIWAIHYIIKLWNPKDRFPSQHAICSIFCIWTIHKLPAQPTDE